MSDIRNLEPQSLWNNFADICAIPHPSKHEAQICKHIIDFAVKNKLDYKQDTTGNIVVTKAATAGYEGHPTVILQSHVDMVPQKNSDKVFDFTKDGIETYIDGEWVKANGTTLGADNGIGCAAMLAVLESKELQHPTIEALFTVDEETGLVGANNMSNDLLTGSILINLDSEDEGELYVGCAGAVNNTIELLYKEEATTNDLAGYKLDLSGLKGGHSGIGIIMQRANANKLLVRFIREQMAMYSVRISLFDGGGLRNAVPREANAIVTVPKSRAAEFEAAAIKFAQDITAEYALVEDSISFTATAVATPSIVVGKDDQKRIISALTATPNGVFRMSDAMIGLVETSTNMSRVLITEGKMEVLFMTRCMVNYGKRELSAMIRSVFELAGAKVTEENDYNGWAPNMGSKILSTMQEAYNELYGRIPEVKAIHAGLECGIIGGKYPELDMISIGPTMRFPHSPDEQVNIATVEKFYKFLVFTLSKL